ncbi:conserved hypothetical protein [uncultured Pleomorphomonas sp.]|uniref:Uncharacterized protein n=1 Tax=uncultured Pleomorphomonas sp. TaxID=442121 RepID=A0A212LKH3_9HYPH|nr:hypothetical protein [uncultured Pleomorphomonas sp.]SCM78045.1 conserved hypothetical protein [uncultured Pleomorphomonas sp.]
MGVDLILETLLWVLLVFCGSLALTFAGLILQVAWIDLIRPALTPAAVIDRLVDDIIASYPDPEQEAQARLERARSGSDGAEQVYWYRVRRAVRRRLRKSAGRRC